jgi:uncharacterized YigZ family protein
MTNSDTYKTLKDPSTGLYKEKGSKFLGFAFPVSDEQEIREILLKLRKEHHSARHHCFAWRLGSENEEYRINDDGEPSGTAGRPIFNQIKSNELTNVLIVVIRYFGGILLGTSGLTNAYKQAASDAIQQGEIIERVVEDLIEVHFDYQAMNEYMHIVKEMQLKQLKSDFQLECSAVISVRQSLTELVLEKLNSVEKLKAYVMKK